MNFGFNSNVHARDAVYHVQTEDRGPAHPYLDTVVYERGRVVHKTSTSYEDFAASGSKESDFAEKLHELLSRQHREVIEQLEAGTLALSANVKPLVPFVAVEPVMNDGLDVRLVNSTTWLSSVRTAAGVISEVTLEIELRERNSQQGLGNAEVEALLEHDKKRVRCFVAHTDAAGKATLKFPMPSIASDGSSLVIRATDGAVYGELRFRLKATRRPTAEPSTAQRPPVPVSK